MTYATRSHVAPGDLGTAADQNQGMDNEEALKSAFEPVQATVIFDGGGGVLVPAKVLGFPYKLPTMTLTAWEIVELEGTTGKCAVDVRKDTYANFPPTAADSMCGTEAGATKKINLNSVNKNNSSSPGWATMSISTDDEILLCIHGLSGTDLFTGSGLDDFSKGVANSFVGVADTNYKVEIDGVGSPNTFKWSDDGGSTWDATGVAITGADQLLNNGVYIRFGATTGHTSGDNWAWTEYAIAGVKLVAVTIRGTRAV